MTIFTLLEFKGLCFYNCPSDHKDNIVKLRPGASDKVLLKTDLVGELFDHDQIPFAYGDKVILPAGTVVPRNNVYAQCLGSIDCALHIHINDKMIYSSRIERSDFQKLWLNIDFKDTEIYHFDDFYCVYRMYGRLFTDRFVLSKKWESLDPKDRYRIKLTFDGQVERTIPNSV
jgi:hypothetical protein